MPTNWSGMTIAQLSVTEQLPFITYVLSHPGETLLLQGVAGSGKTLVAAFALAELQKNQNVGLLVFTNFLEQYIRQNFEDKSVSLVIDHYHSWEYKIPLLKRNMFIVDEAQDFEKDWIEKVKSNSQSQIWVGDIQQQIYEKASKDCGFINEVNSLKESQKQYKFKINYRNPLPIARFASNFITVSPDETANGITRENKIDDFIAPILKNKKSLSGSPVTLIKADSLEQEYNAIAKIIRDIQNKKELKSRRIAIAHMMYRTKSSEDISVDRISDELNKKGISHYRREPTYNHELPPDFTDDNLIIVSPISGLKGLEFDYIFFPHSEYAKLWRDPYVRDNLLFVLFTRAKQRVYCSYVNEQESYIWDRIKDQKALDYIVKINAKDILNPPTDNDISTSPNDINI